jgi:alkane 1-monooxygenase
MSAWRYFSAYSIPGFALLGVFVGGLFSWLTVVVVFVFIPLAELIVGRNTENLDEEAEAKAKNSLIYSLVLWLFVPIPFILTLLFGYRFNVGAYQTYESLGILLSIALSSGGIGITIAHELVHRKSLVEQYLGRIILLSVFYMHFAIEHVRGHHALVATDEDPATARRGQSYYAFWWTSVWGQWISAWELEAKRLRKLGFSPIHYKNEMIHFTLLQSAYLAILGWLFGWIFALIAVAIGVAAFSLLEGVNYIEHYGLERDLLENGRYEKVGNHHSWNSDHVISRMLLFELTRHSDHHAVASRHYQILRSLDESPQLPTGYPGMILLALVPPLWFRVMDPIVQEFDRRSSERPEQSSFSL